MRRLTGRAVTAVLLGLALSYGSSMVAAPAHAAPVICEKWGSTSIQNGRYIVQNNVWGAGTAQCIDVDQTGGFTVTQAAHNNATNGAPAAYPSVYAGCHYANCTTGSQLPKQASAPDFGNLRSSVRMAYPSSGTYNASYDIWFDPTPRTDGQNTGAEVMIWLNKAGSIQPIGSPVGTVTLAGATWQVWFGNVGWNVISYVRTSPATSIDFAIDTFFSDVVSRGYGQRSWYLTSVQAGFEPWIGGTGLTVDDFTFTTSGGGDTTPPTVPSALTASGTTSSGTTLSWTSSTDSGGSGLAGYDILRASGAGAFTQVGTSTTPSFTDTGLNADSTYRYQVRARDGAGNLSAVSSTVTVTTTSGTGGGGCSINATAQNQWDTGYVIQPATVTNTGTSAISGWTVTFILPSGHAITGSWNAAFSVSGQIVTVHSLAWNGALGASASTAFGFQVSRPGGDTRMASGYACATS